MHIIYIGNLFNKKISLFTGKSYLFRKYFLFVLGKNIYMYKIFTTISICLSYFSMTNLVKIECFTQDQENSVRLLLT